MKKITFLLVLLFLAFLALGQTTNVTVIDSITKVGIPYATVLCKDGGRYSSSNGTISDLQINDTILISCISYNSKRVVINEENQKIYLSQKLHKIKEVKVKARRRKVKTLGYIHKSSSLSQSEASGCEYAVFIPNPKYQAALVRKILIRASFLFKQGKWIDDRKFISVYKFNIYNIINDSVGTQINKKPIIVSSKSADKTKVDVLKYRIIFPPDGAFIALEWVGKENEKQNKLIK